MKKTLIAFLMVVFMFVAGMALASNELGNIKVMLEEGNYTLAIHSIRNLLVSTWNKAPLTVAKAAFITKVGGYGLYTERESNVFKPEEKQVIYVEPMGYTFVKEGGMYRFGLLVGFTLHTDKGEKLLERKNFGKFSWVSHRPNTEIFLRLWVRFKGIGPGRYYLSVVLSDLFSDKKARIRLPFVIAK